jgi:hypothetical protein
MTRLATLLFVGVMSAVAFASGSAAASCAPASSVGAGPRAACPLSPAPAASVARSRAGYSHVVVVIEENSGWVSNANAPFLESLLPHSMYFSNYHAVSHPSEPNYLALFSGSTLGQDGSDSCLTGSPARSLAGEAAAAGVTITGYVEGLNPNTNYACRHDPFSQFADAQAFETDFSNFPMDYATLPQISFVIPSLHDDMGDNGTVPDGDSWDQTNLNGYAQWAASHNSLLIIISDESSTNGQPGEGGNIVPMIVVGTGITPGSINASPYDHYSLLHTLEDYFGLGHLGNSVNAVDLSFAYTPPTSTTTTTTTTTTTSTTQAAPTAPTITAASLSPPRFRVAPETTALSARAPLGTTFNFTLSAAASVRIAITKSVAGVRRGRDCVHPTRALRRAHARGCLRTLAVATLERASEPVGPDRIPFSGRVGHHALPGAAYRATLTARNAAGPSKPVTLGFVVIAS